MAAPWMLYSTFPDRNAALAAARRLVEKHLAACANVTDNVTSVYRWEGEIQEETEAVMIAKTTQDKLAAAMEEIKTGHAYELPCIVAWPLGSGYPPFLDWVKEETA